MNLKRVISILLLAAFIMPGIAIAQTPEPVTALFIVQKAFTDDNPGSLDVRITCNIGTPLTQPATISSDEPVIFTVNDILDFPGLRCEIVEEGGTTTGYTAKYWANEAPEGAATSRTSCLYTVEAEDNAAPIDLLNSCFIENEPDFVEVIVDKTWDLVGAGGDAVDTDVRINVSSRGRIQGASRCTNNNERWCDTLFFSGLDPDPQIVLVRPAWDGTTVTLDEKISDSSIETTNTCGGVVEVFPGDGAACSFENTVFFEGIPTLSQYGMAIMALLMLGMGFVGFRRFV